MTTLRVTELPNLSEQEISELGMRLFVSRADPGRRHVDLTEVEWPNELTLKVKDDVR